MSHKTEEDVLHEKRTLIEIGRKFNEHMKDIMELTGVTVEEWSLLAFSMNALIRAKDAEIALRKH